MLKPGLASFLLRCTPSWSSLYLKQMVLGGKLQDRAVPRSSSPRVKIPSNVLIYYDHDAPARKASQQPGSSDD